MNRIYIYVMLFSGILFLNSKTCFAANEKLSASSRQTLDQLIRSDNRLEKLSRQDKDLRLLVQCDEHTTENDLLECGVLSYVSLGNGFYTICISPSELSRFLDSDFVKRAELPRKASLSLDEARTETNVVLVQNGESLSSPYTGKNVVLGFVDSGFDVTHRPSARLTARPSESQDSGIKSITNYCRIKKIFLPKGLTTKSKHTEPM